MPTAWSIMLLIVGYTKHAIPTLIHLKRIALSKYLFIVLAGIFQYYKTMDLEMSRATPSRPGQGQGSRTDLVCQLMLQLK